MQPIETTALDRAFGAAGSLNRFMPKVPQEFRSDPNYRKWVGFQQDWFFFGLESVNGLTPKPGIDLAKAMGHLAVIQGSYEPKHEEKEEAVAYLAWLWFEPTSTWEPAKKLGKK